MTINQEEIKEAIEKSGYLFEQQVSRVIDSTGLCGHFSTTNASYTDDETGKSREIDVLAGYSQTFASRLPFDPSDKEYDQLQVLFLFECKKNYNPVVFFSRDKFQNSSFPILTGIPQTANNHSNEIPFLWHIESSGISFTEPKQWIATQYGQIKEGKKLEKDKINWELNHEDYHESINGLIKAAIFYAGEHNKGINEGHKKNERVQLCLIYPIIVLGGQMFQCKVNDKSYELETEESLLYKRQYYSNKIQAEFNFHVTSLDYLPKLLKKLDQDIKSIENIIQTYIDNKRIK